MIINDLIFWECVMGKTLLIKIFKLVETKVYEYLIPENKR